MKFLRITGIVIASLFFTGLIFVTFFLEGIVENKLDKELEETLDGYYKLTYENSNASLSLNGFSVRFEEVQLSSDLSKTQFTSRFPIAFFQTTRFEVKNINILDLLLFSELNISSVIIENPNLSLVIPESSAKLSEGQEKEDTSKKEFGESAKSLTSLALGKFEITEGNVSMVFMSNPDDTLRVGENIEVLLEAFKLDLKLDSNVFKASTSEQLFLSLDNLQFKPENGDISYSMDNMYFDYKKGELQAANLLVEPNVSWQELNAKETYQKTFKRISLDTFRCVSDNFETLEDLKLFKARSLNFLNLDATMYRDKSKPADKRSTKKILQQVLTSLPIDLEIDSINIRNADLTYTMLDERKSDEPAQLYLTDLNGSLTHLNTTDNNEVPAMLRFEGSFMKTTQFDLNVSLPMSKNGKHSFELNIERMPFENLNPLIRLSNVKLTNGVMDYIRYTGTNTAFVSNGTVVSSYSGFKMLMANENNKKKWLLSGLANLAVRNKNKTDKNNNPLAYPFHYERPLHRGHLDLLSGALIDGIARSMLPQVVYSKINW